MDNELPKNWKWATVGDISLQIKPGFPSGKHSKDNRGIPHLRPMNINKTGEIDLSEIKYVVTEDYSPLETDDILFNNTNSPELLGKTALVKESSKWAYSNHMTRIRIPTANIHPAWVSNYLHYLFLIGFFKRNCTNHVNQASVNSSFLAQKVQLPIPPFEEQKRIVAKIEELFSELDEGITSLMKAQVELKRYRQAVLKVAFEGKLTEKWRINNKEKIESKENISKHIIAGISKNKTKKEQEQSPEKLYFLDLPPEWCWAEIEDIIERSQYGTSDKAGEDQKGIAVIRMGNIFEGKLVFNKLKYFPLSWQNKDEFLLEDGDILFNRTNSFELVGKSAVYKKYYPKAVFASYLIRLKPKCEYSSDLISYYINSLFGRKYIVSVVTQQVGQANVNGTKLLRMPIPIMSQSEQAVIQNEIEKRFSIADSTQQIIEKNILESNLLRQSILKKAFEGELVPQDPNDEPAEQLLEKIRQERAKTQVELKTKKKKR